MTLVSVHLIGAFPIAVMVVIYFSIYMMEERRCRNDFIDLAIGILITIITAALQPDAYEFKIRASFDALIYF